MRLRTLSFVLLAALALGVALWFRKSAPSAVGPFASADATVPEVPARRDPWAADAAPVAPPATSAVPAAALHGLRLLSREESAARGWAPTQKARSLREMAADAVMARWKTMTISVDYAERPIEEVLDELHKNFGLELRIDPEIDATAHKVTYTADRVSAAEAMEPLLGSAGLVRITDAKGTVWITTPNRVEELVPDQDIPRPVALATTLVLLMWGHPDVSNIMGGDSTDRAAWMKGRTVTVSLVNLPLKEALEKLAAAAGIEIYGWSDPAEKLLARAPVVSVIGENLPLADALEQVLGPRGLAFDPETASGGGIWAAEDLRGQDELDEDLKHLAAALEKERVILSERKVRIEGRVLTVRDVAAQLEAQLGEKVRLLPALEICEATWEADGLEQTAGEVLGILANDAPLAWGWAPELDNEDAFLENPRSIWLVNLP